MSAALPDTIRDHPVRPRLEALAQVDAEANRIAFK
jgi:hypothetical protein